MEINEETLVVSEFQIKYNSATLHTQLTKRKRLPNETPRQYVYAMQTIASQGAVEEEVVIQYIIDGILDEETNKSIRSRDGMAIKEKVRTV